MQPEEWQFDHAEKSQNAVLMAEQLGAAGLRPTVYRNVVLRPGSAPVAKYGPLKELPAEEWDLEGSNRWGMSAGLTCWSMVLRGLCFWLALQLCTPCSSSAMMPTLLRSRA